MDNRVELAAALLRVFEGLRITAYMDSGGIWTIGYGHTWGVQHGDTCTLGQAEIWLVKDSEILFSMTAALDPVSASAYVSFGYNCGASKLKAVLNGEDSISNPIHYTDRHGIILPGLQARRALEIALINSQKK